MAVEEIPLGPLIGILRAIVLKGLRLFESEVVHELQLYADVVGKLPLPQAQSKVVVEANELLHDPQAIPFVVAAVQGTGRAAERAHLEQAIVLRLELVGGDKYPAITDRWRFERELGQDLRYLLLPAPLDYILYKSSSGKAKVRARS